MLQRLFNFFVIILLLYGNGFGIARSEVSGTQRRALFYHMQLDKSFPGSNKKVGTLLLAHTVSATAFYLAFGRPTARVVPIKAFVTAWLLSEMHAFLMNHSDFRVIRFFEENLSKNLATISWSSFSLVYWTLGPLVYMSILFPATSPVALGLPILGANLVVTAIDKILNSFYDISSTRENADNFMTIWLIAVTAFFPPYIAKLEKISKFSASGRISKSFILVSGVHFATYIFLEILYRNRILSLRQKIQPLEQ